MATWMALGAALTGGFVSGALPVGLAEVTVLGAAAIPSLSLRAGVLAAFSLGHVAGKGLWYWLGRLGTGVTSPSLRKWLDKAHVLTQQHPTASLSVMASSATVSLPPFHLLVILAGIADARPLPLFLVAFAGRLLRFTLIAAFPSAMQWLFLR